MDYNSKGNRYHYKNREKLENDYGKSRQFLSKEKRVQLFGDPITTEFATENLETITVEGFGLNVDQPHLLCVHKKLSALIINLFQSIRFLNRTLAPEKRFYLKNDRQTFAWSKNSETPWENASSIHDWGIAIDLNLEENHSFKISDPNSDPSWSIPAWVVHLFRLYGFAWGGLESRDPEYKDPGHFEYCLEEILENFTVYQPVFPFSGYRQEEEFPAKYYLRNESGLGGYFPLALQHRTIHGGIHLHPENPKKPQPILASLPGYLVAARLSPAASDQEYNGIRFFGNYSGMVLLRHDIRFKDGENTENSDQHTWRTIYSLYMHLCPVDYDSMSREKAKTIWKEVPWLRKLYQHQYGTALTIDTPENFGELHQLSDEWEDNPVEIPVFMKNSWKEETLNGKNSVGDNFLHQPEPIRLVELIEALEEGELVTFPEPFLPIEIGDIIGFTQSPPATPGTSLHNFRTNRLKSTGERWESGFLHWEIFTTENDDTLVELLRNVGIESNGTGPFVNPMEKVGGSSNFMTAAELDALAKILNETTPEQIKQRTDLTEILKNFAEKPKEKYLEQQLEYLNGPYDFSIPDDEDAIKADEIVGPSHPIEIQLENYQNQLTPGEYEGTIHWKAKTKENHPVRFSVSKDQETTIRLQIPASCEKIELTSDEYHFDLVETAPADNEIIQALIRPRYRSLIIKHANEWYRETHKRFVKKRQAMKKRGGTLSRLDLEMSTWWALPETSFADKELFGEEEGQLKANCDLIHIHPVTAVWIFHHLSRLNKIQFKQYQKITLSGSESGLLQLRWGYRKKDQDVIDWSENRDKLPYGMDSYIAAIYQHGAAQNVKITANSATGRKITIFEGELENGIFATSLPFCFWGEWELKSSGYDGRLKNERTLQRQQGVKPVFGAAPPPQRLAENRFRWEIPFDTDSLQRLQGVVMLKYQVVSETNEILRETTANTAIPIDVGLSNSKKESKEPLFQIDRDGAFYTGINSGVKSSEKLGSTFSFHEYRELQQAVYVAEPLLQAFHCFREYLDIPMELPKILNDGKTLSFSPDNKLDPKIRQQFEWLFDLRQMTRGPDENGYYKVFVDGTILGDMLVEEKEILKVLQRHIRGKERREILANQLKEESEQPFQIDSFLLERFAFMVGTFQLSVQITEVRNGGSCFELSPTSRSRADIHENKVFELFKHLNRIISWEKSKLTLSVFDEQKYVYLNSFHDFDDPILTRLAKEQKKTPFRLAVDLVKTVDRVRKERTEQSEWKLLFLDKKGQWIKVEEKTESKRKVREFRTDFPSKNNQGINSLCFDFDGKELWKEQLQEEELDATEQIWIYFGFRCLNGGLLPLSDSLQWQERNVMKSIPLPTPESENDYIDLWPDQPVEKLTIHDLLFQFGKITVKVIAKNKTQSANNYSQECALKLSVPLIGDFIKWKAANPMFEIDLQGETIQLSSQQGTLYQGRTGKNHRFEALLDLTSDGQYIKERIYAEEITVKVLVENKEIFTNNDQTPPESEIGIDSIKPWLIIVPNCRVELSPTEEIVIPCQAYWWPVGLEPTFSLEQRESEDEPYRKVNLNDSTAQDEAEKEEDKKLLSPNLTYDFPDDLSEQDPERKGGRPLTIRLRTKILEPELEYRFRIDLPNADNDAETKLYGETFLPLTGKFQLIEEEIHTETDTEWSLRLHKCAFPIGDDPEKSGTLKK